MVDKDIAERMGMEENIKKLYDFVENKLSGREKEIIRLRYGLAGSAVTQREISE